MLQAARKLAPSLLRQGGALGTAPVRQLSAAAPTKPDKEDLDDFELLPPGSSLKDPTYGRSFGAGGKNSLSDPVMIYDSKPVEEYRPLKTRKAAPTPPLSRAEAQAKLADSADKKKKAKEEAGKAEDDDELYVYVPPGSSMRDPLPSSLSDPLDNRRVYYRDPNPTLRK